jgi:hypothetical protein
MKKNLVKIDHLHVHPINLRTNTFVTEYTVDSCFNQIYS